MARSVVTQVSCLLLVLAAPLLAADGAISLSSKTPLPTLFVVGDSTASNSGRKGWGDPVADYFDPSKVRVLNRARGGRSSRTYQAEGLWEKIVAEIKSGDFVLIQFGHNDGGPVNSPPARGSLKGLGEETQESTARTGQKEVVHTYGWYLRKYLTDTKAKGATPILLSLTVRNIWKDGKVERGPGSFGKWTAEVARTEGVTFVDVTTLIADEYEKRGEEKVKAFFPIDHTHTSAAGADLNASLVVAGLKRIKDSPLAGFLSAKGEKIEAGAAPFVK